MKVWVLITKLFNFGLTDKIISDYVECGNIMIERDKHVDEKTKREMENEMLLE